MVRYVRPRSNARVHEKSVTPTAIGKARDLYAFSEGASERDRQRLELELFGPIDNRAAIALEKLDTGKPGSTIDKVGLVQFVLSLQLRSPSCISHMRGQLAERMADVAEFSSDDPAHQTMIADHINNLLADLISSENIVGLIASMKVFRIAVQSKHKLLTCDLPMMMSQGIAQPQGFLMFPYAPDRIAIFAHDAKVASAFSTQEPNALARAINDAVVQQAREFVIAADHSSKRFVENRFMRDPRPVPGDGMMRWKVP